MASAGSEAIADPLRAAASALAARSIWSGVISFSFSDRHCEEPKATKQSRTIELPFSRDCFASLAMTLGSSLTQKLQRVGDTAGLVRHSGARQPHLDPAQCP